MQTNVLVVGAGPTGLTMALQALRAGLSVRVVDKASGPSKFSKAIGLQYRVSEVLAHLGLADRILAAGTAPGRVTMYAGRRVLLSMAFFDFSSLTGRGAFVPSAVMIPQSETERLLGDALETHAIAFALRVRDCRHVQRRHVRKDVPYEHAYQRHVPDVPHQPTSVGVNCLARPCQCV